MNESVTKKIIHELFSHKLTDKYMIKYFKDEVYSYICPITPEDCIQTLQDATGYKDLNKYSCLKMTCLVCNEDIFNDMKFQNKHFNCDFDRCFIEYNNPTNNTKTHIIGYPISRAASPKNEINNK